MAFRTILVIATAFLALSQFSEVSARAALRVKRSNCLVTLEYSPVCGTNGETYGNPSSLKCDQKDSPYLEIAYKGACREAQSDNSWSWYGNGRDSDNSDAVARRQAPGDGFEGGNDNGLESGESEPQQQTLTYDDEAFYPSDATM